MSLCISIKNQIKRQMRPSIIIIWLNSFNLNIGIQIQIRWGSGFSYVKSKFDEGLVVWDERDVEEDRRIIGMQMGML